jgi:PilZ domain-containing protein
VPSYYFEMQGAFPGVGQTVVVQFGPSDLCFTRCEVAELADAQLVLTPFDALSGAGRQGDGARLIFTQGGQPNFVDAALMQEATSNRLVVVPERRREPRRSVDLRVGMTVVGEATPVSGQLRDLSLGGLGAYLSESLPAGLRAVVKISDDQNELVRVVGEVVGMSSLGPTGARNTHMRFVDIPNATRDRLEVVVAATE